MTKEEKIKGLYSLKEYLVENPIELEGHKSLAIILIDYAIEALEQEPVIDKIRAEIKVLPTYHREILTNSAIFREMLILDEVMQIIDKYKEKTDEEKR